METLKEIMNNYNQTVEFPFLGNTLVVSKERNIYNQLRLKYNEIANNAKAAFIKRLERYTDAVSLSKGLPEDFIYAMKAGMDELTKDAISIDCYTLDTQAIVKLGQKKGYFSSFDKAVKEYKEGYVAILSKGVSAASNVYNDAANHPTLQVSTIGGSLGDVAFNQLKADMVNSVIGEIYADDANLQVSDIADKTEKEAAQYFQNPVPRNKIINSIWTCACNLRLIISNELNKEYNLELGGWTTNDESSKAEAMYNNLNNSAFTDDKKKEIALTILQLYPLNSNYYKTFLTNYLDNAREILAIADFFKINLSYSLKTIIENFAKNNTVSSFEDIVSCRKTVKSKIAELGFPSDSIELAEDFLQKQSAVLISEFMKNNMGESRKEVLDCFKKAGDIAYDIDFDDKYQDIAYLEFGERMEVLDKELIAELNVWIDENLGTTEDDAHKCREELTKRIEEEWLDEEKAAELFKKIDERLKKLDEEYRTVEGFVFPTRESADEIKSVINDNKDILYKETSDFIFRSDYVEHIEKIKTVPLIDKLVAHFTEVFEKKLKEFDKKCKNAKLYDDKMKGQKKSLMSLARSVLVSDEKQKEDWNEVTKNGEYLLSDIMGVSGEENSTFGGFKGLFGKK